MTSGHYPAGSALIVQTGADTALPRLCSVTAWSKT